MMSNGDIVDLGFDLKGAVREVKGAEMSFQQQRKQSAMAETEVAGTSMKASLDGLLDVLLDGLLGGLLDGLLDGLLATWDWAIDSKQQQGQFTTTGM